MTLRTTHTLATLELSRPAWDEIAAKLRKADYRHAFLEGDLIDMQGIGVTPAASPAPETGRTYTVAYGELPGVTAVVRAPVIVEGHFAARPVYGAHPAGVDGLLMEYFTLDHMPSGLKIHGGAGVFGTSLTECLAMAKSLSTMPVDWSSPAMTALQSLDGSAAFQRVARYRAEFSEWIAWSAPDVVAGKVTDPRDEVVEGATVEGVPPEEADRG